MLVRVGVAITLGYILAGMCKQQPLFGAKICTDIFPWTLSVPKHEQFSDSEAGGKL